MSKATEVPGRLDSPLSEELGPLPAPTCGAAVVPGNGYVPARAVWTAYSADDMRAYALVEVQRSVSAMMSRCQGKVHEGCAYLGHCGMVCNKCGQVA